MASVIRGDDNFDSKDVNVGAAKAWVNFDGTGTPSITNNFNVSSITDFGVGSYGINFATDMANTGYVLVGTIDVNSTNTTALQDNSDLAKTVSQAQIKTYRVNSGTASATYDATRINVVFFGD